MDERALAELTGWGLTLVGFLPNISWRSFICPVPMSQVKVLSQQLNRHVWRYDAEDDQWVEVGKGRVRTRPGEILLIVVAEGGYDPVLGLDARSNVRVALVLPDGEASGLDVTSAAMVRALAPSLAPARSRPRSRRLGFTT